MNIQIRRSLFLAALAGLPTAAQQEYRLRVTVNLVQVDATVTDSRGKPVPGLTSSDFQILLDGKPQSIASCSFIEVGSRPPAAPALPVPLSVPKKLEAALPPMPVATLKREDVRRTVVLFVDDLSMSSESVPAIRNGLRKFTEIWQPSSAPARVSARCRTLRTTKGCCWLLRLRCVGIPSAGDWLRPIGLWG